MSHLELLLLVPHFLVARPLQLGGQLLLLPLQPRPLLPTPLHLLPQRLVLPPKFIRLLAHLSEVVLVGHVVVVVLIPFFIVAW